MTQDLTQYSQQTFDIAKKETIDFFKSRGFKIIDSENSKKSIVIKPLDPPESRELKVALDQKKSWKKYGKWEGYGTLDVPLNDNNYQCDIYIVFNNDFNTLAFTLIKDIVNSSVETKNTHNGKITFFNTLISKYLFFKKVNNKWIEINKNGGEIR